MAFHIVVDSQDPDRIAPFWSGLLHVEIGSTFASGQHVVLTPTSDGLMLGFQRVPEPKAGKNRVHIDLLVEDLDEGTARVEALGGCWIDPGTTVELNGFRWRCMADPEGNEFCIYVPPSPQTETS